MAVSIDEIFEELEGKISNSVKEKIRLAAKNPSKGIIWEGKKKNGYPLTVRYVGSGKFRIKR